MHAAHLLEINHALFAYIIRMHLSQPNGRVITKEISFSSELFSIPIPVGATQRKKKEGKTNKKKERKPTQLQRDGTGGVRVLVTSRLDDGADLKQRSAASSSTK